MILTDSILLFSGCPRYIFLFGVIASVFSESGALVNTSIPSDVPA